MIDTQKKLDAPTLLLLGGIVFWVAFIRPSGMDFELRDEELILLSEKDL